MIFNNKQCVVLSCRDISKMRVNAKLSAENKMLTMMSSSISHELLNPLRCIEQISKNMINKNVNKEWKFDAELIMSTANMLLTRVKGNLDKNLLDSNMFRPNL